MWDSVIFFFWVDGNFKVWKCRCMEVWWVVNGEQIGYQNCFVLLVEMVECEFCDVGFVVQKYFDFILLYYMWWVYIL